jgi:protein associated with RNAse G/E
MRLNPTNPSSDRPQVGETVTVHKLDSAGDETWRYPSEVLRITQASITLVAIFDREDRSLGGLELRRGDRFIETFYTDRWYNVFRIHDGQDDHLKGWYCNITRPARIEPGHIYADDLALDLVVLPDAEFQVLDEDEFEALDLSPDDRQKALGALEELKTFSVNLYGPFNTISFD